MALAVITIGTNSLNKERARNQAIAAVLAAPDARIVSGPTTAGGTATTWWRRTWQKIVFTSSGLRVLPIVPGVRAGVVPRAWQARGAGLMPPTGVTRSTAPVLASGLETGDSVGVTVSGRRDDGDDYADRGAGGVGVTNPHPLGWPSVPVRGATCTTTRVLADPAAMAR